MLRRIIAASALLIFGTTASAAESKDLAELFPAGTLAYAEIGQPVGTSDAFAEFVKGTLLADSVGYSHDRRDKMLPPGMLAGLKNAGEWSLFASPEMLADFKKFKGVAAALTGFDPKTGRPALAVAFVLGESRLAGFLARQYLLTAPNVRRVGKIDGIAVYQNRGLTGAVVDENNKPQPNDDPAPAQGTAEPTYFYAPGLLVIGSNVGAVQDVYRRFAGTEKTASFATSTQLKSQAEARKKPGVFFCADVGRLELQLTAAKKVSSAEWLKMPAVSYVRFLLNPKQVESFTGSLQLQPDGWALAASAVVQAGGTCPLLALLAGGEASFDHVRGAPVDAPGAFTVAFPAKEKRAKAILDAADAIGQALGHAGALPGESAAEAEKKGFKLSAAWLPVVKSLSVILPKPSTDPKAEPVYPMVILTLDDDAAALGWLGILPKISQVLSGVEKLPDPASETIQNVKVWGLVHDSTPIHYALAGSRIILGRDRDVVAKCATSPANPWPKADGQPAALGALAFANAWALLPDLKASPTPKDGARNTIRIEDLQQQPDPGNAVAKEWGKALAAMPPLMLQAKGSGQKLTVELIQKDLKKPLAKWLEAFWQTIELEPVDERNRFESFRRSQSRDANLADSEIRR